MPAYLLCVMSLMAAVQASGSAPPAQAAAWDFESSVDGWDYISCMGSPASIAREGSPENRAVRLDVDLPAPASMARRVDLETSRVTRISYKVFLPEGAPYTVKALFYLKDKDGLWFQGLREEPLEPGRWNEHVVDLSPQSAHLRPRGHFQRWNRYLSHKMNLIGIKLISADPYRGPIYIDEIRGYELREKKENLRLLNFCLNSAEVKQYDKLEISFQLNRMFCNPFDPEEVSVEARFTAPSGKLLVVPGFYHQEYISALEGSKERLTPVGQGSWKVRFAAQEAGEHKFRIYVRAVDDKLRTAERSFEALPSDNPGFVRVSKEDPRYFEFDNGDLFYPIGHNFRSPNDARGAKVLRISVPPDRGTYAYEDMFPKMAAHGENFAEVWMCSWWLDIEWIPDWKYYQGLGDYNLANAWKLDRVLQLARENDIYVHLVIDNHGKTSAWCDPEWRYSPYNLENGGILNSPEEFFSDPRARELYKRKLRYIVARWAYDAAIAGFELWSELDLTGSTEGFMRHRTKVDWHSEMTDHLKTIDPWQHILTTHYSTNYTRVDPNIVTLPNIDYVTMDAYRQGNDKRSIVHLMTETYNCCRKWRKPHLVTEYGGTPFGGLAHAGLESDLHAGLWAGWMLPMASPPLLWWFDFIDRGYPGQSTEAEGLYFHFRALGNYSAGEERRDRNLNVGAVTLVGQGAASGRLKGMCLQSQERAYCWIYDDACMQLMQPERNARKFTNTGVRLYNLKPGKYDVEFWHTYKGTELTGERQTVSVTGNLLQFTLPAFKRDVAVKVKPHERGRPPRGSSERAQQRRREHDNDRSGVR